MIEVELKFALPGQSRLLLQQKLAALPALQRIAPVENVDTYYDTTDFVCFQQAVFLRIRDHARLEIKYHEQADPAHLHTTERVFPLTADSSAMHDLNALCSRFIPGWMQANNVEDALAGNQLTAFVRVEKLRTRYVGEELTLYLDQVSDLGDFFEVEVLCMEETEVVQAQARLQDFVASLGLPVLWPVKIGYVELWLRAHLPHIYLLGKYQNEAEG
ncbi:MAG: hypothetical protein PVS3B1_22100 [Ktedonobacteraceae bacterium]